MEVFLAAIVFLSIVGFVIHIMTDGKPDELPTEEWSEEDNTQPVEIVQFVQAIEDPVEVEVVDEPVVAPVKKTRKRKPKTTA